MESEMHASPRQNSMRSERLLLAAGYTAGVLAVGVGVAYETLGATSGVGEIVGGLATITVTKLGSIALHR